MRKYARAGCWLGGVVGLAIVGIFYWLFFAHGPAAPEKKEAETEPIAPVRVAPLHHGEIERTLVVYGTAATAPGGTRSVAYPFECRVVAVQANVGQTVAAGDALLQIELSADAKLSLDTARSSQQTADKSLRDTQNRFKARLATNADLAAAESAARDAQLKLASLQSRLPDAQGTVKAPATGVVTKLPAGPGTVVVAGGPLAEIAVENRFEARLGIAPADAGEVKPGQVVHLTPVQSRRGTERETAKLQGTVRVIGASIDPATRMVDAFVILKDAGTPVLIGTYLRAEIVLEKKQALLAPRAAVLPAEGGDATLFTVADDKAVKHTVAAGLDDGVNVEILKGGEDLPDGTNVVTEGAYELKDKMEVEVAKDGADQTGDDKEDKPTDKKEKDEKDDKDDKDKDDAEPRTP